MKNHEKRYIDGTKPAWGYELPDDYANSMVSKDGRPIDTGWNYDEKDSKTTTFDDLKEQTFDKAAAEKARAKDAQNENQA